MSFGDLHLLMLEKLKSLGRDGLKRYMNEEYENIFPIFPKDEIVRTKLIDIFASHQPGHYVESGEYYTSLPNLVPAACTLSCPVLEFVGEMILHPTDRNF